MSAAFEIQKALYAVLSSDTDLGVLVGSRIYDDVPDNQNTFPFVTIGEDTLTQWDTDQKLGYEVSLVIHVWSRYRGRKETKEIQAAIYDALHNAPLSVTGYDNFLMQEREAESFLDPDGKTRHGIQTYHALIERI